MFFSRQTQHRPIAKVYGYIPQLDPTDSTADSSDNAKQFVKRLISHIHQHISVSQLVQDAQAATEGLPPVDQDYTAPTNNSPANHETSEEQVQKRTKIEDPDDITFEKRVPKTSSHVEIDDMNFNFDLVPQASNG